MPYPVIMTMIPSPTAKVGGVDFIARPVPGHREHFRVAKGVGSIRSDSNHRQHFAERSGSDRAYPICGNCIPARADHRQHGTISTRRTVAACADHREHFPVARGNADQRRSVHKVACRVERSIHKQQAVAFRVGLVDERIIHVVPRADRGHIHAKFVALGDAAVLV